jgi:mannose-6-phosphate isomerase class I
MQIVAMLAGRARIGDGSEALALAAGQFGLVPASLPPMSVRAAEPVTFLRIEL